jgi:hypothetical protein
MLIGACSGRIVEPSTTADGDALIPQTGIEETEPTQDVEPTTEPLQPTQEPSLAPSETPEPTPEATATAVVRPDWHTILLTDVRTGEEFTLENLAGNVVVIETMAVWCPLCETQQKEIKRALARFEEGVIAVSLDVDPGESAEIVAEHAKRLKFNWRFALAGPELSGQLSEAFGPQVLAPTATTVIILNPDGGAVLAPRGIKNANALAELIEEAMP